MRAAWPRARTPRDPRRPWALANPSSRPISLHPQPLPYHRRPWGKFPPCPPQERRRRRRTRRGRKERKKRESTPFAGEEPEPRAPGAPTPLCGPEDEAVRGSARAWTATPPPLRSRSSPSQGLRCWEPELLKARRTPPHLHQSAPALLPLLQAVLRRSSSSPRRHRILGPKEQLEPGS